MRVGEEGLRIKLMKVAPGAEPRIDRNLNETEVLYKGLGEFDVVAFQPLTQASDVRVQTPEPEGVLSRYSVLCFSWEDEDQKPGPLAIGERFLTLSLLKISPSLLSEVSPAEEERIARHLLHLHEVGREEPSESAPPSLPESLRVQVLGSFGWHEIVLLVGGPSLTKCLEAVAYVTDLRVRDVLGLGASSGAVFHASYTVPSVNYDVLRRQSFGDISERVSARIYIDAVPITGGKQSWIGPLEERGMTVQETFGAHDFYAEPNEGTISLGILLELLLRNLRMFNPDRLDEDEDLDNPVTATLTVLGKPGLPTSHEQPRASVDPRRKPFVPLDLQALNVFTSEEIEGVQNLLFDPSKSVGIRQMFATYNAAIAGDEASDAVRDLWPFLQTLADALKGLPRDADPEFAEDILQQLHSTVHLFSFGFMQRLRSTLRLRNLDTDMYSADYGTIQRSIVAASTLPIHLSSLRGTYWDGFLVFGFEPECRWSDFGIINLTANMALDPASWWQLSHETGHDIEAKMRMTEDKELEASILKWKTAGDPGRRDLFELASEIFADVFDFAYGFRGAWSLYVSTVWRFLLHHPSVNARMPKYLVRSLFVRLYKEGFRPEQFSERILREQLSALCDDIGQHDYLFESGGRDATIRLAASLERVYELVWLAIGPQHSVRAITQEELDSLTAEIQPILAGEVLKSVGDPRDIILGLLNQLARQQSRGDTRSQDTAVELPFKARAAALLTLWRLGVQMLRKQQSRYSDLQFRQEPLPLPDPEGQGESRAPSD